jgi:hypothetical protein
LVGFSKQRDSFLISITSTLAKEKGSRLRLVDLVNSFLQHRQLVLLEQQATTAEVGKSSAKAERVIRRYDCRVTWVATTVGFDCAGEQDLPRV